MGEECQDDGTLSGKKTRRPVARAGGLPNLSNVFLLMRSQKLLHSFMTPFLWVYSQTPLLSP